MEGKNKQKEHLQNVVSCLKYVEMDYYLLYGIEDPDTEIIIYTCHDSIGKTDFAKNSEVSLNLEHVWKSEYVQSSIEKVSFVKQDEEDDEWCYVDIFIDREDNDLKAEIRFPTVWISKKN